MGLTSLQRLCLNRIAKDIKIWCDDGLQQGGDMADYLYLLGPFDNLGPRQVQELLNILVKNKQLKASYLHTLLHGGLTSVDIGICSFVISDSVIKFIVGRCQKIVHLVMQNCSRVSSRALQELTLNLPSLHFLDLSGCILCNDHVLVSLGKNCKDLQVLKLDSCKKVTDLGLKGLCGDSTSVTSCSKLVEISLSGTSITTKGVLNLLMTQPYLQSLSLSSCQPSSFHTKEAFFNDSYLSLGETKLKYLDLSNMSIDDSVIANLCKICPSLTSLIVTGGSNLTGVCLNSLTTLHDLKHLHIDASGIDCNRQLKPFLAEHGYHLEILHLPASCNFDLEMIGQYCSNLTSLSTEDSTNLTTSFIYKDNKNLTLFEACPHLKYINFQNCSFSDTKSFSEHLSLIFSTSSCELESLNLSGIKELEFENISKFIESIGFSNLRRFDISRCPLVTNELVFIVVNYCKKLEMLNVSDCWKVNRCDIEVANEMIKRLGQQIELVWT